MRHHNANRKLGRVRKVRKALMSSLALSLINKSKIKTTDAKARELRPFVEKIITLGKKGTLASQRLIISRVGETGAKKVVSDLSKKFSDRAGGYTRITKLPRRSSDASLMAYIEFV